MYAVVAVAYLASRLSLHRSSLGRAVRLPLLFLGGLSRPRRRLRVLGRLNGRLPVRRRALAATAFSAAALSAAAAALAATIAASY